MDTMSNEHTIKSIHDNQPNSLLTFFSTLTSSFRPQIPSKSSYGKHPHPSHSKIFQNGFIKHEKTNSIYHEINIDKNINKNSVIIELSPLIPVESDEYLINEKSILTTEHFLWIFILTILYFTWFIFIAGITLIHIIIYSIILLLYLLSDRTRRLALALLIYLTYLLLYDALHVIPNYTISKVHIRDIYLVEKNFFGISKNGQVMTLNEYFKLNHIPFLDIFTGVCYLNW